MKRRFRAAWIILSVLWMAGAVHAQQPSETNSLRVLFIGNSYTYYNNLPEMFAGLASSAGTPRPVEVQMIAPGGVTLEEHWRKGDALKAIRESRWDWVVLQEQSQLGVKLVNRQPVINDPENFHEFARLFVREIGLSGANAAFLHTWARRNAPNQQTALDYAYMSIAKELQVPVIPVGIAWAAVRARRPELNLYTDDGSHPSPAGSYLAACLIYAVLFGESPEGLSPEVIGHPIRTGGSGPPQILLDTQEALVSLDPVEADWLQQVAWNAYAELQASGGYRDVRRATDPTVLLALPSGGKVPRTEDLIGVWRGPLNLYSSPATMELRLSAGAGGWDARAVVEIRTAGGVNRYSYPAADFMVRGSEISFTISNPTGTGVDEKYRAVFTGNSLSGIVEFGSAADPPFLLGSWELRR